MTICSNCNRALPLVENNCCEECFVYRQDYYQHQWEIDNQDEYVIVSREMAIDAGDRQLEGQLWKW